MKKLLILTYCMRLGGVENVIATISEYFASIDVKVIIVTLLNVPCAFSMNNDIRLIPLNNESDVPKGYQNLSCMIRLRKIVDRERPDIILSMPEEVTCKALPFILGYRIPIVVSERNNPWISPKNIINKILRKTFYPFAAGYVFQTKSASLYFNKRIRRKSCIIPNPINTGRLPITQEATREKTVVTIGRLSKQKNHDLLLDAFHLFYKSHMDYKLIIYGAGDEKEALQKKADILFPEGVVEFPGFFADVLERVKNAGMFVLSSDYEGMPNVLIEAMAMGLPCISTDCPSGGPRELINDKENGLLVSVRDASAMCQAMSCIADDDILREKIAQNAKLIREKLDVNTIMARWNEYLNHCTKNDCFKNNNVNIKY